MRRAVFVMTGTLLLGMAPGFVNAQQTADPKFIARVERPAHSETHPVVVIDEAHHNYHTAGGRYRPFADLLKRDGYRVRVNRTPFSRLWLDGAEVWVIVNALGAEGLDNPNAGNPAFTDEECDAVVDWVKAGGALLLIVDRYPTGQAVDALATRLGVEVSTGYCTIDRENGWERSDDPSHLEFSHANGLLGDHPITRGRDVRERIEQVVTFTGQSLQGPVGSVSFLTLSETAVDVDPFNRRWRTPAGGRSQGLAFPLGKGRVVMMGEAAMFTAQVEGPNRSPFGLNVPGLDNRQLALNVMHWLSGDLGDEPR